jgi:hypothetical protein
MLFPPKRKISAKITIFFQFVRMEWKDVPNLRSAAAALSCPMS